jgi:hypothetical protein
MMEKEVLERMLEEFKNLSDKTNSCRNFILDKEKLEKLDALNQDLLIAQLKAMEAYLSVLSIRIGINGKSLDSDSEPEKSDE